MNNIIHSTNKSAFSYTESVYEKVDDYCIPLQSYLGIKKFGYLRFFKDSPYFLSVNNFTSEYRKKYFENIHTQGKVFRQAIQEYCNRETKVVSVLWPTEGEKDLILSLVYDYDMWNGISIHNKTNEGIETFSFAFDRKYNDRSSFFLDNMYSLKHFCRYFKVVAKDIIDCSDKSKLAIYKNGIDLGCILNSNRNEQITSKEFIDLLSRYQEDKFGGNVINFSKRELECIKLLAQGKTAKEIGVILKIHYRTVESYIAHAKNKTGCNYKSELLKKFNNTANLYTESHIFDED